MSRYRDSQLYQDPWANVGQSANNALFKYFATRPTAADQANSQKAQLEAQLMQNRLDAPDDIGRILGDIYAQSEPQGPTRSGAPMSPIAPTPEMINQRYSQQIPELMRNAMMYSGDSVGNLGDTMLAFAANGGGSMPQISNAQLGAGQGYEKTIQGVNEAPFTLGPGSIRFNGDGSQRAAAPFKLGSSGGDGPSFRINLKDGTVDYGTEPSYVPQPPVINTSSYSDGQDVVPIDAFESSGGLPNPYPNQGGEAPADQFVQSQNFDTTGNNILEKGTIALDGINQSLNAAYQAIDAENNQPWKSTGITGTIGDSSVIGIANQLPVVNKITNELGLGDETITRIKSTRAKLGNAANEMGRFVVNGMNTDRYSNDDREAADKLTQLVNASTDHESAKQLIRTFQQLIAGRIQGIDVLRQLGTGAAGRTSQLAPPPEIIDVQTPKFSADPSADISKIIGRAENVDSNQVLKDAENYNPNASHSGWNAQKEAEYQALAKKYGGK